MTRRLHKTVRLFSVLAAAMQFALPAVVSIADGNLARASQATESRPDGVAQTVQKPAHPVDCVLCWYLSANLAQPGVHTPPPPVRTVALVVETPVALCVLPTRPGHHSRAPPTLLG